MKTEWMWTGIYQIKPNRRGTNKRNPKTGRFEKKETEKKCDIYEHSWVVVADSYNKKYYECEWCDATMQHPK